MDKNTSENSEAIRHETKEYSPNPILTKLQKVLDTRIENDEVRFSTYIAVTNFQHRYISRTV